MCPKLNEISSTDVENFAKKCAAIQPGQPIPDDLKEESAAILIADLRAAWPDYKISCMCGNCINLTAEELADNLESKWSEYKRYTEGHIRWSGIGYRYSLEKSTKPNLLKNLQNRLKNLSS